MDGSPVVQEGPPNVVPLQCILKDSDASGLQWQNLTDKVSSGQTSKLLFFMVEYIQNLNDSKVELNYTTDTSESDIITPVETPLSERHLPCYNTLVIPSGGQSFQNSVVVLPASRNHSQQISIVVNNSQNVKHQREVEELKQFQDEDVINQEKLNSPTSQSAVSQPADYVAELDCDPNSSTMGQKLIITMANEFKTTTSAIFADPNSNEVLDADASFFHEKEKIETPDYITSCNGSLQYSTQSSETVLLCEPEGGANKTLLHPTKYVIEDGNLKEDELLLSDSDQSSELLVKSEGLMEVDSYNLTQAAFIASEDGSSYPIMEEHLNINTIEKVENEYLLPDAIGFEDSDPNLLQSNLEVFTSQVLDTNELLLYDKTRLRQPRKHPAEHLGFDYWCEDCEFGMKCDKHEVKIIPDKPVLSRARATLPKELLAINKLNGDSADEGIFARKTIMRRVQFGPVEGKLLKDWDNDRKNASAVELLLEVETDQSNWMRFVRKAESLKEQNLILTQQGKSLYFTTTRVIPPRQELKVGYSPQYAERRKLRVLEDLSWNCFECTARLSSSEELQRHLNIHESDKAFMRKTLKKKSNKNNSIKMPTNSCMAKNNLSEIGKADIGKENECWTCQKIFPKNYSLKRHLLSVHSGKGTKNESAEGSRAAGENCEKLAITNTLFKKKPSSGAGSEWLCTHCNLTFDNPSVLNLHTLTHAAEDLESEAVLGLPSELASVYHEGEFLIENGDVQCPQCTQEFPSKRELIDHVSTHGKMTLKKCCSNKVKPYKCDRCYKSFASDIRLQKHMLVHGSEETKPYQCEVCSKRFLNNSALSCHLKTHSDKKCFECPLCKKEFKQIFGLKEHVKVHSSDGFFTCPDCSKVFEGYSVIRKHIRTFHSGLQHMCKDCGKLCSTLDKLKMHSLKHSDHREFLCANCGKQFKRKDKLKEHMKRMHSVEREMKLMSMSLRIPNTKDRRFPPKVMAGREAEMSLLSYDRFIYKCRNCMVGFKRRGMLVNHLAKRHPDIVPDTVPELNLPILKTTRDYFCQYCDKIYKSSSKRKAHILKNHPGAELPMSNRQKGGVPQIPGIPNPTFSQTVGSVKTTPHGCKWCHKQYASKAKLLQHQRKKHMSLLPQSQQVPKLLKNPSSPVGSKIVENSLTSSSEKWKEASKEAEFFREESFNKTDEAKGTAIEGNFAVNGEFCQELEENCKKTGKGLSENLSCEYLQQAMTELSQSLSEYKLPFSGTQENLLKVIELKEGGDGVAARQEDMIPAAQMTRTWPDLPPYPPR